MEEAAFRGMLVEFLQDSISGYPEVIRFVRLTRGLCSPDERRDNEQLVGTPAQLDAVRYCVRVVSDEAYFPPAHLLHLLAALSDDFAVARALLEVERWVRGQSPLTDTEVLQLVMNYLGPLSPDVPDARAALSLISTREGTEAGRLAADALGEA